MAAPQEFQIPRSHALVGILAGVGALGLGVFLVAAPLVAGESLRKAWMVMVTGLLAFAGAAWCLRLGLRPRLYSIELSDEGVRLPETNRWAPWSALAGLAERPTRQRVDLIDRSGARFASLEYQLEGFDVALDRAVDSLRAIAPPQDVFRRAWTGGSALLGLVTVAGLCAFGIWSWRAEGSHQGLLAALILPGLLLLDAWLGIWSVALEPAGIRIRKRLRNQLVPRSDVSDVVLKLVPAGNQKRIQVFLCDPAGKQTPIRPAGVDPFLLHARVRAWLREGMR